MGKIISKKSFPCGERFLGKFEGGKFNSCSLVCRLRGGELVWTGNKLAEEACLERLAEGTWLWCLAIIVIFMGLGVAKRMGGLGGF